MKVNKKKMAFFFYHQETFFFFFKLTDLQIIGSLYKYVNIFSQLKTFMPMLFYLQN